VQAATVVVARKIGIGVEDEAEVVKVGHGAFLLVPRLLQKRAE
jgi:hypothetical protein